MDLQNAAVGYVILGCALSNIGASFSLSPAIPLKKRLLRFTGLMLGWCLVPLLLDASYRNSQQPWHAGVVMAAVFTVLALPTYFASLMRK